MNLFSRQGASKIKEKWKEIPTVSCLNDINLLISMLQQLEDEFFKLGFIWSIVYGLVATGSIIWTIFCILQEKIQDLNKMFVEYYYRSRNQLKWSSDIWGVLLVTKRAYFASNTCLNSPNDQDQRQVRLMALSWFHS